MAHGDDLLAVELEQLRAEVERLRDEIRRRLDRGGSQVRLAFEAAERRVAESGREVSHATRRALRTSRAELRELLAACDDSLTLMKLA